MSIWLRISEALAALTKGEGLYAVFDRLSSPPEKTVAFTIAVIALGAKMAKADGQVTKDEVVAFRRVFYIPASEEAGAARVFNLARQDVSGFDHYARRITKMFGAGSDTLNDLLEGLFHIAMADGFYHPNENKFLEEVSGIFGISEVHFKTLRARHVPNSDPDPFTVLGIKETSDLDVVKSAWRRLVRESHPDIMMARGVPEEAVKLAEKRLIQINRAYEAILAAHT